MKVKERMKPEDYIKDKRNGIINWFSQRHDATSDYNGKKITSIKLVMDRMRELHAIDKTYQSIGYKVPRLKFKPDYVHVGNEWLYADDNHYHDTFDTDIDHVVFFNLRLRYPSDYMFFMGELNNYLELFRRIGVTVMDKGNTYDGITPFKDIMDNYSGSLSSMMCDDRYFNVSEDGSKFPSYYGWSTTNDDNYVLVLFFDGVDFVLMFHGRIYNSSLKLENVHWWSRPSLYDSNILKIKVVNFNDTLDYINFLKPSHDYQVKNRRNYMDACKQLRERRTMALKDKVLNYPFNKGWVKRPIWNVNRMFKDRKGFLTLREKP